MLDRSICVFLCGLGGTVYKVCVWPWIWIGDLRSRFLSIRIIICVDIGWLREESCDPQLQGLEH